MTAERTAAPYHRVILGPLPPAGLLLGVVLAWFSLGSSLLPRGPMMQGVISALSFSFGYAIGVLVCWIVKRIIGRFWHKTVTPPAWSRWLLTGAAIVVLAVMILRWPAWQTDQGALVGVDPIGIVDGLKAAGWTLVFTAVLLFLGRSIRWIIWKIDVFNDRHLSVHIARAVTVGIVVVIVGALYWFIASSGLTAFANERFGPGDETTLEGIVQPQNPEASGSPDSLVAWDDLGYQGRTFTGAATSTADIAAYYGVDEGTVKAPIRVYAGLKSASSVQERAQLVVDELIRTNAQDRALLVVVASTGTGWVDPISAAAVEYLYRGDTAIAAIQYSFLPSWISFILDTATSTEAGVAINAAVIDWWKTLPENDRPTLVAFGESLGTLGSEAAFARPTLDDSLAEIQRQTQGVLWVGPTDANLIHSQLLADRDPSSPVWRPVYHDGAIVRTRNHPGDADGDEASWQPPRVLYYHHPSDPVGYWNWETLWKPQEWSDKPVGYDVPDSVRWVPFTTFTQVVVDLINGFSASVGHGHNYNDVFVEGWSIVAPVDGWTAADTMRLSEYLLAQDLPGL